ncbi:MAG: UDP-N-acetylglucosamine 2-epimerase (non-hydrolyzing) [Bacteroidetes bacterium]|jgi:UDP-N-acetylglucosamine 2-epimerase (non-hydrolysing)|nr:UDP-N-acetylglucosamine 2-epimerase (non-hydrolyzing) [Bacteroidota bacterium]
MTFKIISVVGARPNFIKIAPLDREFQKHPEIEHIICHTGQHFDKNMSEIFFEQLGISKPAYNLGISGGSHASQVAEILTSFEKVLIAENPDLIVVPGDVNSTLAAALTASKLGIPVAHIESGLRSFDRNMPEEINRLLTDQLADLLFVTEKSGLVNLKREGVDDAKVFFTGNIMIDSLVYQKELISNSEILKQYKLEKGNYAVATFHRPSNVDDAKSLQALVLFLNKVSSKIQLVIPLHPRTKSRLEAFDLLDQLSNQITLTEPLSYLNFLSLVEKAKLVITDSGGIQEETTFLGVPCITVRNNTERPVTVDIGTNMLAGTNFNSVWDAFVNLLNNKNTKGQIPELWDGKTAERIYSHIIHFLKNRA